MLKEDHTVDPATGLPNLFGLLEAVHAGQLGSAGTLVAVDIGELSTINNKYGRKAGDHCVRGLAGLLRAEMQRSQQPALAFRIGGDEFVLALPLAGEAQAQETANRLQALYLERMAGHGISTTGLHTSLFTYGQTGATVAELVQGAYLALKGCRDRQHVPAALPPWAEELINHMVEHICETLAMLRKARTLALTDDISGLPNHRAAAILLDDMLREYNAGGPEFSVLLVDGDNLRTYNELGYERGNQMIRDLGEILVNSVRYEDRVTRWLCGDEFLVLLPGANRQVAAQVGERLRVAVETGTKDWVFPITVSIGIACCPADGKVAAQLLSKAERQNFLAKQAGKNQVS